MSIYIRADSSNEIGTGHIMRCLTLANVFRKNGHQVTFITKEQKGHLCDYIKFKGFNVKLLPAAKDYSSRLVGESWKNDACQTQQIIGMDTHPLSWLIIDHYGIDYRWEKKLRKVVKNIFVIDDLANRKHECDLLLDQNYFENSEDRYKGLVPKQCKLLLGPKYTLLREEFTQVIPKVRNKVGRIFVFMGGTDPTNETLKIIHAFLLLQDKGLELDVIAGKLNPHKDEIKSICMQYPNIKYYEQVENMAELMAKADLALGAGGTTVWERCYLGLPSIVITIADNQEHIAKTLNNKGAVIYLGSHENVSTHDILHALRSLLNNNKELENMSLVSLKLMERTNGYFDQLFHNIFNRKDDA